MQIGIEKAGVFLQMYINLFLSLKLAVQFFIPFSLRQFKEYGGKVNNLPIKGKPQILLEYSVLTVPHSNFLAVEIGI